MLRSLLTNGWWGLLLIPLRLLALVIHEYSHGFVSSKLGDPTPRLRGRLTLNPLAHLDFIGTVLMLLTGFGWAKPVEVNPMYYKDRKKGMALVALAGPLANFILFISLLIYIIFLVVAVYFNIPQQLLYFVGTLCSYSAQINLCFMVFNLIPIPPLDGSRILGMFLGDRAYYTIMQYERYSMYLIMFLSLFGFLDRIIGTGVSTVYGGIVKLLAGAVNLIFGWNIG